MKNFKFVIILFLSLLFLSGCDQIKQEKDCIVQEWKVMDLYRNNYPSLIDTICNNNFVLFNHHEVDKTILDSTFFNFGNNSFFSMDTSGIYEITARTDLEYEGLKYQIARLSYLSNGHNVDQEILLWVIKDKGIFIQQESKYRKVFLLNKIKNKVGVVENTIALVNKMMADTILFPKPPPLPSLANE